MRNSGEGEDKNLSSKDAKEIIRLANIIYFRSQAYENTYWMGVKAAKCPMDMWVYQELMHSLNTDLLIETGTYFGGSALFFAHMFDVLGRGKVISVDIALQENLPKHPRIQYIKGSSTGKDVIRQISTEASNAESVMVILDSDHAAQYKLNELEAYAKFVTSGSYIIAEDSCFDHYPAWPEFGPGPAMAIKKFVKKNRHFEIDRSPEKHMITFSPKAFLKRRP